MLGQVEISFVIPVFNGARSIGAVVETIHREFADSAFEIVLVNDGSADDSEDVCSRLAEARPATVRFLQLARNFGEHNAVLAGLTHCRGAYAAILDDDGQNPPAEVHKMMAALRGQDRLDVVYGRYTVKQHSWFRNFGSWLNDRAATILLKKPSELYLSSFKVMNRFLIDEVTKYKGAFPYIDGLIFRTTRRITQVDVEHRRREAGTSNYTLRRLIRLWLNMFLGYSVLPLRVASLSGIVMALCSVLWIALIIIDRVWINPQLTLGIPTVLAAIVFFSGLQLLVVGLVGEYLGRMFIDFSGAPQFIVRYVTGAAGVKGPAASREEGHS